MLLRARPLITEKSQPIPGSDLRPQYSDARFWRDRIHGLTVFLVPGLVTVEYTDREEVRGLHYLHSSVIAHQKPSEEYKAAWDAAKIETGTDSSAAFFDHLLSTVLDREVDVQHILSGVNVAGDGNPYQYFGLATERTT